MTITNATPDDAPLIADAILSAIGDEITRGLAGRNNTVDDVRYIFKKLAQSDDSQYSWRNTRIARDDTGNPAGVCISYDGADLIALRRPFFRMANDILGWQLTPEEIDALPGETDPDEFYLDTLMVLPDHRRQGVGRALINDTLVKARSAGKPLGLLCDIGNDRARRLYDSSGFACVGQKPFAGHLMNHLRLRPGLNST